MTDISQEILERDLFKYTIDNSHYDVKRNYIGLSKIIEPAENIVALFNTSQDVDAFVKLKCYKGYQMERVYD